MTNQEIAKKFEHLAATLQVLDNKKYFFQIRSYQTVTTLIHNLADEISDIYREKKDLEFLPGIGPAIEKKIIDLLTLGRSEEIESLLQQMPPGMFPLLDIPEIGARRAFKLATVFHLNDPSTAIAQLEELAKKGMIRSLEGFGEKSEADILENISRFKLEVKRIPLARAEEIAQRIVTHLKASPAVKEAMPLGSLRRKKKEVGDIDIGVATTDFSEVKKWLKQYSDLITTVAEGDNLMRIITADQIQVDVKASLPEEWGSFLQHFTGSKDHNIRLREYALKRRKSLSEHGMKDLNTGEVAKFASEKKFYEALGLKFIPPSKRINGEEIEKAKRVSSSI